ncbi:low molecular weight protein-tyrosine-phosphatase [Neisseria sp.]|uniref:low molecular weight protein-tyrosine-phosphatase n=1 Tax=Neisseria sp. TaxID=192066 RepID=UPI0028989B50|nr:low molecular weight protein-tyrosine-phosphatase [Neisseria sp.]
MRYDKILTVCSGNICRSPLAEHLLKPQLPNCFVASAGVTAWVGQGVDLKVIDAANRHHLNISGLSKHNAKQLTPQMCIFADLILVMEEKHIAAVAAIQPLARSKIMLLGQWTGQRNIPDPYRKDQAFFDNVYQQIADACNIWAKKLSH